MPQSAIGHWQEVGLYLSLDVDNRLPRERPAELDHLLGHRLVLEHGALKFTRIRVVCVA